MPKMPLKYHRDLEDTLQYSKCIVHLYFHPCLSRAITSTECNSRRGISERAESVVATAEFSQWQCHPLLRLLAATEAVTADV